MVEMKAIAAKAKASRRCANKGKRVPFCKRKTFQTTTTQPTNHVWCAFMHVTFITLHSLQGQKAAIFVVLIKAALLNVTVKSKCFLLPTRMYR